MKRFILFSIFLMILLVLARILNGAGAAVSGTATSGRYDLYLGQEPPGNEPEIFAPGIVSIEGATDYVISFSRDGKEIYWSRANSGVMSCRLGGVTWSDPAPADFGVRYPGGEVHIMADGQHLLMNRFKGLEEGEQGGVYRFRRLSGSSPGGSAGPDGGAYDSEKDGGTEKNPGQSLSWGEPEFMIGNGMRATSTRDGVIYVTDITHHLSREEGKDVGIIARYIPAGEKAGHGKRLQQAEGVGHGKCLQQTEGPGGGINTEHSEAHPFIAPDESYLIFNSRRPGGAGEGDLYISYRLGDGSWTKPINLEALNTPYGDWGATVSPDGKYLFFTRNMTGNGDIYWVSTDFIEELRPR